MKPNTMDPSQSDQSPVARHLGTASFSVSSRVALQLGRESISSSVTAIVELVKNSYDADATRVRVRFANLNKEDAFIVIDDTGIGMTIENLREHWLIIGTANKVQRKKTAKQRTVTGEKGLGRLGLDRLCSRTLIESIREGATEGIRFDVQWDRYEGNQDRLEAVTHDLYSIPNLNHDPISNAWQPYPHGTRLVLQGLKDDWDKETIEQLRNELALLVSPFQGPNDFSIEIDTGGEWPDLEGSVSIQKPLLEAANWKVVATLDDADQIEITMSSPRHETEYHLRPTTWNNAIKKQGTHSHCGPLRMEFYFFVRRDAELTTKTLRASEIVNFLKFNQGVRIYRDGFRVKPYGEPDGNGDWLRLAFRRMQNPEGVSQNAKPGNWRVGYNQIVGAVFITHEKNAGLNDQTNREGLLQGKAFDHLNVFALRVIQFFEIHHQRYEMSRKALRLPAEQAEETAKSSIDGASEAIKELTALAQRIPALAGPTGQNGTEALTVDSEIRKVLGEVQQKLESAAIGLEQSTKLYRESEEQKNTMANLASLGILAAAFGHETLDWTGTVAKNVGWLHENLVRQTFMLRPDVEDDITTTLTDTVKEAQKVRKFARFTLGNLSRDKRRQRHFDVGTTIKRVFEAFEEVLTIQRNTHVDLEDLPSTPCLIDGYEMDWESIVVNLITNASWALEDKPKAERKIKASLQDGGTDWVFVFDDSGVGLEAGTENMIFLPAFSTKRSARGEIIGTGMGLFIVRSFVEDHSHGVISAKANGELGGASFEIKVPKANNSSNGGK